MKILRVLRKAFKLAWCLAYHEKHHEHFVAGSDMAYARYMVCKKCDERYVHNDSLIKREDLAKKLQEIAIRRQKR